VPAADAANPGFEFEAADAAIVGSRRRYDARRSRVRRD